MLPLCSSYTASTVGMCRQHRRPSLHVALCAGLLQLAGGTGTTARQGHNSLLSTSCTQQQHTLWAFFGLQPAATALVQHDFAPLVRLAIAHVAASLLHTHCLRTAAGGSHEGYVKWACAAAASRGWRSVVLNMRGCNGLPLTSARGYNAINTSDVHVAVQSIHRCGRGVAAVAAVLVGKCSGICHKHSVCDGSFMQFLHPPELWDLHGLKVLGVCQLLVFLQSLP